MCVCVGIVCVCVGIVCVCVGIVCVCMCVQGRRQVYRSGGAWMEGSRA